MPPKEAGPPPPQGAPAAARAVPREAQIAESDDDEIVVLGSEPAPPRPALAGPTGVAAAAALRPPAVAPGPHPAAAAGPSAPPPPVAGVAAAAPAQRTPSAPPPLRTPSGGAAAAAAAPRQAQAQGQGAQGPTIHLTGTARPVARPAQDLDGRQAQQQRAEQATAPLPAPRAAAAGPSAPAAAAGPVPSNAGPAASTPLSAGAAAASAGGAAQASADDRGTGPDGSGQKKKRKLGPKQPTDDDRQDSKRAKATPQKYFEQEPRSTSGPQRSPAQQAATGNGGQPGAAAPIKLGGEHVQAAAAAAAAGRTAAVPVPSPRGAAAAAAGPAGTPSRPNVPASPPGIRSPFEPVVSKPQSTRDRTPSIVGENTATGGQGPAAESQEAGPSSQRISQPAAQNTGTQRGGTTGSQQGIRSQGKVPVMKPFPVPISRPTAAAAAAAPLPAAVPVAVPHRPGQHEEPFPTSSPSPRAQGYHSVGGDGGEGSDESTSAHPEDGDDDEMGEEVTGQGAGAGAAQEAARAPEPAAAAIAHPPAAGPMAPAPAVADTRPPAAAAAQPAPAAPAPHIPPPGPAASPGPAHPVPAGPIPAPGGPKGPSGAPPAARGSETRPRPDGLPVPLPMPPAGPFASSIRPVRAAAAAQLPQGASRNEEGEPEPERSRGGAPAPAATRRLFGEAAGAGGSDEDNRDAEARISSLEAEVRDLKAALEKEKAANNLLSSDSMSARKDAEKARAEAERARRAAAGQMVGLRQALDRLERLREETASEQERLTQQLSDLEARNRAAVSAPVLPLALPPLPVQSLEHVQALDAQLWEALRGAGAEGAGAAQRVRALEDAAGARKEEVRVLTGQVSELKRELEVARRDLRERDSQLEARAREQRTAGTPSFAPQVLTGPARPPNAGIQPPPPPPRQVAQAPAAAASGAAAAAAGLASAAPAAPGFHEGSLPMAHLADFHGYVDFLCSSGQLIPDLARRIKEMGKRFSTAEKTFANSSQARTQLGQDLAALKKQLESAQAAIGFLSNKLDETERQRKAEAAKAVKLTAERDAWQFEADFYRRMLDNGGPQSGLTNLLKEKTDEALNLASRVSSASTSVRNAHEEVTAALSHLRPGTSGEGVSTSTANNASAGAAETQVGTPPLDPPTPNTAAIGAALGALGRAAARLSEASACLDAEQGGRGGHAAARPPAAPWATRAAAAADVSGQYAPASTYPQASTMASTHQAYAVPSPHHGAFAQHPAAAFASFAQHPLPPPWTAPHPAAGTQGGPPVYFHGFSAGLSVAAPPSPLPLDAIDDALNMVMYGGQGAAQAGGEPREARVRDAATPVSMPGPSAVGPLGSHQAAPAPAEALPAAAPLTANSGDVDGGGPGTRAVGGDGFQEAAPAASDDSWEKEGLGTQEEDGVVRMS